MITGTDAEQKFVQTMNKQGCKVVKATEEEDMFKHIDFYVDGKSYDVKGNKRIGRHAVYNGDVVWIERTNVRGADGWLFGKAELIAFLIAEEFWIIPRESLLEYVNNDIPYDEILSKKGYKTWYRRRDRLDCVTYVHPEDIEKLVIKKYKVE